MLLPYGVPERILLNVRILNPGQPNSSDDAVAVSSGRIVALGPTDEIAALANEGTYVEDLGGRTIIPGLIDAHNHLLMTGQILQQVQLYDCRSIGDIQAAVAKAVRATPTGQWILGRGWDESLLAEGRHPTRHDLDAVAPDHPVVIHRVWNRLVANSMALELAGINRETPDPDSALPYSGGFERDAEGHPTGLFRDRAKDLITSVVPEPTINEMVSAIGSACREYNRLGITAVSEPGLAPDQVRAFHQAALDGILTVRTAISLSGWGFGSQSEDDLIESRLANLGVMGGFGSDLLWINGVKLMPDGGVGDRTARMYQSYEGEPDNFGTWTVDPSLLHDHIIWAHDHGLAMDIHTCGDEAQDVAVRAFAEAQIARPNHRLRHRVHHAYLPTDEALDIMAEHKIPAVVSNPFVWSLGESYRVSIGDARAAMMMPMRTYLDRGVPLAGSSDSPVATHNPWIGMASAINRTTVAGTVLGPEQCLTSDEALSMYTEGGAFVLDREDLTGKIEVGAHADFVLLDEDPRIIPTVELHAVSPVATMMNGRWVHDSRQALNP